MTTQTCFLLSYVKYGDNGAILNCFSKEQGFQSFFMTNIYSPKNKKKSYLFPLHQIQITLATKRIGNALQNISKIETVGNLSDYENTKINSILFFISDFLYQVLREEQNSDKIYSEIEVFLEQLYDGNWDSYVSLLFKVLTKQGISPLVSDEVFLNPELGIFSCVQSIEMFDEELSSIWKSYLSTENSYQIKLKRGLRKKVIDSLMLYYSIHFHGFHEPISLNVIQQIYE